MKIILSIGERNYGWYALEVGTDNCVFKDGTLKNFYDEASQYGYKKVMENMYYPSRKELAQAIRLYRKENK